MDLPDVPAGERGQIRLHRGDIFKTPAPESHVETWLTVSLRLKADTAWAEVGHEVAWIQHQIPYPVRKGLSIQEHGATATSLTVHKSQGNWCIKGLAFDMNFNGATGNLSSWRSNGEEVLAPDNVVVTPGFWRAPTDNDRPNNTPMWKLFGLDHLTTQLRSISSAHNDDGSIDIHTQSFISPPILHWGFDTSTRYTVTPAGKLRIALHFRPRGSYPKHLPRAGLDLRLSRRFVSAAYVGLGPGESYPDKRAAAKVGRYEATIEELMTPYDVPQEGGNRMDARFVRLVDGARGLALEARAACDHARDDKSSMLDEVPTFSWAVSRYSAAMLEEAHHPCDLVEDDALTLRLDYRMAGVGTAACGPDTEDRYRVKCEEMKFVFEIALVAI